MIDTTTLATHLLAVRAQMATMLPPDVDQQFAAFAESLGRRDYPSALGVGSEAPMFALPDHRGETVRLQELLARGPVVIAFYRGQWCPYCNVQLRAYQAILPDLTARHAQLVAISPQKPDDSLTMAERHDLSFPVLSDIGCNVAEQFGIAFSVEGPVRETHAAVGVDLSQLNGDPSWRLPVPATYIVDREGIIAAAWMDGDYRNRVEPTDVLAALDRIR